MHTPDIFVAIDFETADRGPDSACSVGLVRVEHGEITVREHRLIRPPRRRFEFTDIHGITWQQVRDQPVFRDVWTELLPVIAGATALAAHNAPFDRGVLAACCEVAGLAMPELPFHCTVQRARRAWGLPRNRLSDVCAHLGIPLCHHDALSDAEACARILLAADRAQG